VGFVASPKWRPRTDVYETADELIVQMDIAGLRPDAFQVELADGVLTIAGERPAIGEGKRHYHAMEVQVGPFERRLRLPVAVEAETLRAGYEHGFLEVRLRKVPPRPAGPLSVKVT
jgi:HSP20 family protein